MRRAIIGIGFALVSVLLASGYALSATIRNSEYGFEVTIPEPVTKTEEQNVAGIYCVKYECEPLSYVVMAFEGDLKIGRQASTFIAGSFDASRKMTAPGVSQSRTFQLTTAQGVPVTGGESLMANDKASMYLDSLYIPLNEAKCKVLTVTISRFGGDAVSMQKITKDIVASVRLDDPKAAMPGSAVTNNEPVKSAAIPPQRVEVTLSRGEIDVRGVVTAIDRKKKTVDMLAKQVTEYGKQPVDLNPNRPKKVLFDSIPADVRVNSSIVVVGKNSGVGKPMKASRIVVQPE